MAPTADDLTPLRQALGDLLAAHRAAAGLTQKQLSQVIGYARVTIGTAESGHRQPAAEFWVLCDDALSAGGELTRAYQHLADARSRRRREVAERKQAERSARAAGSRYMGTPVGSLTMPTDMQLPTAAASAHRLPIDSAHSARLHEAPVREVFDYLEQQWHALVRADNLLGPAHALTAVLGQVRLIEELLHGSATGRQARLWGLGARYAESTAWLYEDLGHQTTAAAWTSRALEWAHAADDPAMVSWALFRRSQQAAAAGDASGTLALAQAASRDPGRLTRPMLAAVVQQHAQGLALAGDERGSLTRLDEALEYAAPVDAAGDAARGHGSFCTTDYLQMQQANCWMLLGRPDRAVHAYRQALTGLPKAYHRDRGHAQARLGRALAAIGEIEEAAVCSTEAVRIAAGTGSGRMISEVRHTVQQLSAHTDLPSVAALAEAVHRLGPAA